MKSELQPVPWKLHLAVFALALAFPFVFPSAFMLNFGVMALFYAFIGQSWNISGGFAGQLSFGHVAFLASVPTRPRSCRCAWGCRPG